MMERAKRNFQVVLQNLRDAQVQREFQRKGSRLSYLQSLCLPHSGVAVGADDAVPSGESAHAPPERKRDDLAEKSDSRPPVRCERLLVQLLKSLTSTVYAERFPRQTRNQKKQELSVQRLEPCVNGEVCSLNGDWVNIRENYQTYRTPPAITRTQEDGALQTVEPPSKVLAKLLKWTVHTLEIYWWGQNFCDLVGGEFGGRTASGVERSCGVLQRRNSGCGVNGYAA